VSGENPAAGRQTPRQTRVGGFSPRHAARYRARESRGDVTLDTHALTITGRRSHNEDAVCARADLGLFVVADGMCGYEGGEVLAQWARRSRSCASTGRTPSSGTSATAGSIGVTLVELATGTRPFDGETPLATMDNVRAGARPDLSMLPASVADLALRALAPSPADRFASSEDLRSPPRAASSRPRRCPTLAGWLAAPTT
jgi:serine/threonine protein kinase